MLKKILIVAATLAVAVPVSAQVPERPRMEAKPDGGVPAPTVRQEIREERKEIREERREQAGEIRKEAREERKEIREERREQVGEVRKEYREEKREIMDDRKDGLREIREERREDRSEDRKEFRDGVEAIRSSSSTPEQKREAMKALLDQRKAEAETRREEFKAEREKIVADAKAKRETLKKELEGKVKAFKDKAKAEVVKTVADQFDAVNQNVMKALTERVAQIEGVLAKMGAKADELSASGKDIASVTAAIQAAKTKIEAARTAIATQTAKTYSITVTTEEAVKQAAKTTREQLSADLEVTRTGVKAAHEAVRAVGALLAPLLGVQPGNTTSSTQ